MATKYFGPKRPGETITLGFNFVNVLASGETIDDSTWTVELREGTDSDPTTTMVIESPIISGTRVSHLIGSGIDENIYAIVCEIDTSLSQKIHGVGLLKVDLNRRDGGT
jgi:hypothetical protein